VRAAAAATAAARSGRAAAAAAARRSRRPSRWRRRRRRNRSVGGAAGGGGRGPTAAALGTRPSPRNRTRPFCCCDRSATPPRGKTKKQTKQKQDSVNVVDHRKTAAFRNHLDGAGEAVELHVAGASAAGGRLVLLFLVRLVLDATPGQHPTDQHTYFSLEFVYSNSYCVLT